jgi:4-hydroxy-2-oxoheptanedioate aldolase
MLYREHVDAFLERVLSDQVCLGAQHSIMSPHVVEMYGWAGLDFVVIGTEVEAIDKSTIENLLRAANGANIVPIVKLAHPDPKLVAETLNWGASRVLCPHITSRAQLDELVAAARFYPIGTRGECPIARYTKYGVMPLEQSRDVANTAVSIIPIIEDKEALENIDEIMACPQISLVEIGPFDFSRSLEAALRGPAVWAAIDKIVGAARAAGKRVMMPMWITPDTDSSTKIMQWNAEKLIARGITVLFQPDIHVLADHFRNLLPMRGIRLREEDEAEEVADEMMMVAAAAPAPETNGATNGHGSGNGKAKPRAKPRAKTPPKKASKPAARRR